MSIVSQSLVNLSEEVGLGDLVYNFVSVFLEESESLSVFPLLDEGANAQKGNLTDFVRLHILFLAPVLHIEFKHALNLLVAPIIVPALVARTGQLDPVLHDGGLEEQQFSARFLEADKVSQVHLQLYQLSHRLLVIRVALQGK